MSSIKLNAACSLFAFSVVRQWPLSSQKRQRHPFKVINKSAPFVNHAEGKRLTRDEKPLSILINRDQSEPYVLHPGIPHLVLRRMSAAI